MIRLNGRQVPGFALGADDPFLRAETDLETQLQPAVTLGDKYLAGIEKTPSTMIILQKTKEAAAIESYAKAGNIGTAIVAPEIVAAGQSAATGPFIEQAAAASKSISDLDNQWTTSHEDALRAQTLAKSMVDAYGKAIDAGRKAASTPSSTSTTPTQVTPPPDPTPPSAGVSPWAIAIPVAVVAVAGTVYVMTRRR